MKTSIADLILKYVEAEGVENVFDVPGTTLVLLLAVSNPNPSVRPILAKHEDGAETTEECALAAAGSVSRGSHVGGASVGVLRCLMDSRVESSRSLPGVK